MTKERTQWVLDWPGQTVLCIGQLYWTANVTSAFLQGLDALNAYVDTCNTELNHIVELVRGKLSKQNRTTLGKFIKTTCQFICSNEKTKKNI